MWKYLSIGSIVLFAVTGNMGLLALVLLNVLMLPQHCSKRGRTGGLYGHQIQSDLDQFGSAVQTSNP